MVCAGNSRALNAANSVYLIERRWPFGVIEYTTRFYMVKRNESADHVICSKCWGWYLVRRAAFTYGVDLLSHVPRHKFIANDPEVDCRTVTDWSSFCRKVCLWCFFCLCICTTQLC